MAADLALVADVNKTSNANKLSSKLNEASNNLGAAQIIESTAVS